MGRDVGFTQMLDINGGCHRRRNPKAISRTKNCKAWRFSKPGVSELARLESQVTGCIPGESDIWKGINKSGVQVACYPDAGRVRGVLAIRDIMTRIISDILGYASLSLDFARYAKALDNALWHSIRADQARGSDTELPDDVNEAFFPRKDVLA